MPDITMSQDDFNKIILGLNALSGALLNLNGSEIKDLDGDPDPDAWGRWHAICDEAHLAAGRAKYTPFSVFVRHVNELHRLSNAMFGEEIHP